MMLMSDMPIPLLGSVGNENPEKYHDKKDKTRIVHED